MKTTIVPAQVTTVEDKVFSSLSVSQIMLFLFALFLSTGLYILIPPTLHLSEYKLILIILSLTTFLLLALRIKEKILYQWVRIVTTYMFREKAFVASKNDLTNRLVVKEEKLKKKKKKIQLNKKPIIDLHVLEELLREKKEVRLSLQKGGIHVSSS